MTTPAEKQGWTVLGKFYDHVPLADWTRGESILAHDLTKLGDQQLFSGRYTREVESAYAAVAMARANPTVGHEQIIALIYQCKDTDIDGVGFTTIEVEDEKDDARPPDEDSVPSTSSSGNGEEPSE